jgi:hypothetical protein
MTIPLFVQMKPSSLDLYLPNNKESNLKKKNKAIVNIATTPKTLKQVCSLIGMINYYKDHIPCHSNLLTPLSALT